METKISPALSAPEADLIARILEAGLRLPECMTVMVTDGCNLRCRHCWLDCLALADAAAVDSVEILRIIDAFAPLGVRQVNLTGGEILSHQDWERILRFCIEHPAFDGVCLQTNATLITRRRLNEIQRLPPDKLTIQVSLDGAGARSHDMVRGIGSFDRAMRGLSLLLEAGYGPRIQVAFTEMAHNFDELPALLRTVDELGINRLISGTLINGGRAGASAHMQLPRPGQYRQLLQRYQTDPHFKTIYERKGSIAAIEWFKHRADLSDEGCGCLKNIFVDSRGRIYPCTMLLLEDYASESAYGRPLDIVIRQALVKWRELPALHHRRRNEMASCSGCPGRTHCRGGCLGRAASSGQGLMAPEDRCLLRKAVYGWRPPSDANQNNV
jgi:radical SAM protein with 4Fe4S-binding SPASM domain